MRFLIWLSGVSIVCFGLMVAGLSHATPPSGMPVCPNLAEGEEAVDCPWASVARALNEEAEQGKDLRPSMEKHLPGLRVQFKSDAKQQALQGLWGKSINYDEYAKGIIVHPAILDALADELKFPRREGRIVHAGMEHTYGYLFSILKTPFGYKRARWVREDIETGFGLPRGTLGPTTRDGTLLANVTLFIGKIAFHADPESLERPIAAAKVVQDFSYSGLMGTRLEETLLLKSRKVVLRTDIVPFVHSQGGANSALLIYSVYDSDEKPHAKLISAFPVAKSFGDKIFNPAEMGDERPIITRYNAYVEGVTGSPVVLKGSRKSWQFGPK